MFRVDMRLRPWGDGSALAISHAALEKYLSQHGREWERYAWIKARIVSGGVNGDDLLAMTRPFVFRKYVDYTAFEAMREMKAMISVKSHAVISKMILSWVRAVFVRWSSLFRYSS